MCDQQHGLLQLTTMLRAHRLQCQLAMGQLLLSDARGSTPAYMTSDYLPEMFPQQALPKWSEPSSNRRRLSGDWPHFPLLSAVSLSQACLQGCCKSSRAQTALFLNNYCLQQALDTCRTVPHRR